MNLSCLSKAEDCTCLLTERGLGFEKRALIRISIQAKAASVEDIFMTASAGQKICVLDRFHSICPCRNFFTSVVIR
jgi:hypothetical protein